ncbi:MAG: hypothetical protein Q8P56_00285 [Candidatus Uhrbacteria bacterium]|nr:hypothetical protein [Candidatus Uhrbacteria bacterium]
MNPQKSLGVFKALAWFVSIYHFVLGILAILAPASVVVPIVNTIYGVNPNIDAKFLYMVKFIGAYMIMFAVTAAILAYKPVEYRKLVWVLIGFFMIRILERLFFFGLLSEAFNVSFAQDLRVMIPIAILAIALYYFRPQTSSM